MFLLQKEQKRLQSESDSSSQSSTKYPWDTPFNRALNILKGKLANEPPEYGRVVGAGDGAMWKYYYHEDTEVRKQRRKLGQVSIQSQVT